MLSCTDGIWLGEIQAITNCSKIFTDPKGAYKLDPRTALSAYSSLSLYTTAEACPMVPSLSVPTLLALTAPSAPQRLDGRALQNTYMQRASIHCLRRDGARFRFRPRRYLRNHRSCQGKRSWLLVCWRMKRIHCSPGSMMRVILVLLHAREVARKLVFRSWAVMWIVNYEVDMLVTKL